MPRAQILATFGGPHGSAVSVSGDGRVIAGVAQTKDQVERPCLWKLIAPDRFSQPCDLATLTSDPEWRATIQIAAMDVTELSADGKTVIGSFQPSVHSNESIMCVWSAREGIRVKSTMWV
jgi:hypothetical protein